MAYNIGMRPETARKLIELNHQFYQTFAEAFSATRQRLQPGVTMILDAVPPHANLLDLGSGNGELAAELSKRDFKGNYLGVDFSTELVDISNQNERANIQFMASDLSRPGWADNLPNKPFDYVFCFAVMHHFPSQDLRIDFLKAVHSLLKPEGRFIHSHWQFLNSPKLKDRIQPWSEIGLTDEHVDENDYLLDWRSEGRGLRYVHHYTKPELQDLASKTNFRLSGLFTSDGLGNNLGLYQIWEPA